MGERPTKYFFNLEKRNYIKKTITELRMEDETVIKKETQILDAIENYFSNLYLSTDSTTQEDYDEYIQDLSLPRLSDEERDNMEGVLTYEECKKVLETFQNDKSPGEDGFTVEFYKFFSIFLDMILLLVSTRLTRQMSLPSLKEEESLL